MINKKKYDRLILILLSISLIMLLKTDLILAESIENNKAAMDKYGNVTYDVKDTTKTSSIYWETIGFIVKNCPTKGEPTDLPKGVFSINEENKISHELPNGKTYTRFTFPSDYVTEQFNKAKVTARTLEENDNHVFLNGILQVYHNGKSSGAPKKTLKDIQAAEDWKNKKDFEDRFDIKVPYNFESDVQPVFITIMKYSSKGYSFVSRTKVAEISAKKAYRTRTADIAGTIISGVTGNKLYLYRTHWAKMSGPETPHTNGTYRLPKDVRRTTVNPRTDWDSYKLSLQALRNRTYDMYEKGIEIVCVYKNASIPVDEDGTEGDIHVDLIEPNVTGNIRAESMGAEQFDSEEGIPTSEYQYVNVTTSEYLTQYTFRHYSGTKQYQKKIPADPEVKGSKDTYIPVSRTYSYWKIIDLNVYKISGASIENYSLPNSMASLSPSSSYHAPAVSCQAYTDHIIEPEDRVENIASIQVRNDSLIFNGRTIMNGNWRASSTVAPDRIPAAGMISAKDLYRSHLLIETAKANGEYESAGTVHYVRIFHLGGAGEGDLLSYDIEDINNVVIHTPVICDAQISDVRKYNQMQRPDQSVPGLVLDTKFSIRLPTEGYHSDLKGYQYRDYAKYTKKREVNFPFDVFYGTVFEKAGTWITISGDDTFYLPVWVKEGVYTVRFRSRAVNCDENNGLSKTEELANLDFSNYTATDTAQVEISGRIYGLNLYDVSDYPLWRGVFRNSSSLTPSGVNYTAGTKDRNGKIIRSQQYTLPLLKGSHPDNKEAGAVKRGYFTRFSVRTIGNYRGDKDYIHISPIFYFVDAKGRKRQEADLYYTETFEAEKKKHRLVKVGSKLDRSNIHTVDRSDPRMGANGGTAVTRETKGGVYSFGDIKISENFLLLSGNYQFDPGVKTKESSLLKQQEKSVQTWFCEYYLPSDAKACPKGYDVKRYASSHGGLDFKEPFWLTDGYIIVNFQIESVKDGEKYLSYINQNNEKDGYCNMWKMEGGALTKRAGDGNIFSCMDGDFAYYEAGSRWSAGRDFVPRRFY